MRSALAFCVLLLLSGPTFANDDKSQFVSLVGDAAAAHDSKAFIGLFCEPSAQDAKSVAKMIKFFSRAYASASRLGRSQPEDFALYVCFESPQSKEMCRIFPVNRVSDRLCIVGMN